MTVSESIINWLLTFDQEEYWKIKKVDTDLQSARVDSYSLVKEPVKNVKSYLSGRKEVTEHYTFQARLLCQENADRVDNIGFGEALEGWVEQKNKERKYPEIMGTNVKNIAVTTPFCVGKTMDNSFIYQMTIAIKYERKEK